MSLPTTGPINRGGLSPMHPPPPRPERPAPGIHIPVTEPASGQRSVATRLTLTPQHEYHPTFYRPGRFPGAIIGPHGVAAPLQPRKPILAESRTDHAKRLRSEMAPSDGLTDEVVERMLDRSKQDALPHPIYEKHAPFLGISGIGEFRFEESGKKLGSGTFGVVIRGQHKETGMEVALKRVVMHKWVEEGLPITAIREIKILKALDHPNIVPLLGMSVVKADRTKKDEKDLYYMIFPFCKYDLSGLLENPAVHLQKFDIKVTFKQIVDGIVYLHQNNIIHRDIKAANILMSHQGIIKIADFGLARPYDTDHAKRKYTATVVTRWYRSPELLLGERRYTTAVDIWSVGCVFAELFKSEPIFMGTSDEDQKTKIWNVCGAPNDEDWPGWRDLEEAKPIADYGRRPRRLQETFASYIDGEEYAMDLLDKLLTIDPKRRYTGTDAQAHPYFTKERRPMDPSILARFPQSHEIDKESYRNKKRAIHH